MTRCVMLLFASLSIALAANGDMACDLAGYKPQDGLKAQLRGGVLEVTWQGERREQLRASFAIQNGQPVVRELAAQKDGGGWIALGQNLTPEFQVTSGVRRLSSSRSSPLKELGVVAHA